MVGLEYPRKGSVFDLPRNPFGNRGRTLRRHSLSTCGEYFEKSIFRVSQCLPEQRTLPSLSRCLHRLLRPAACRPQKKYLRKLVHKQVVQGNRNHGEFADYFRGILFVNHRGIRRK